MRCLRIPFAVFLLSSVTFWAQTPTATMSGRVLDPTRAVIPGATVEAISVATGVRHTTQTSGSGLFTIVDLLPGNYRVEVSKPGFRTIVKPDVLLHVQDVIALNFDMSVGSTAETVTVEGGAPLINTEDASVSTVIDRNFAENLPMNGRSFQTLIQLTPGVVVTPTSYQSQGQFSVNGQRADSNYFTVDGTSANVGIAAGQGLSQFAGGSLPALSALGGTNSLVSVDAMQEFRVETSSFAPEFGRTPGGQVSIITRSGTNRFHGTVFDYFRNDALDANDWFADHNGQTKPKERQNDFGGVLGGPLVKDNTFFFFSYEGLRLRQPQSQTTIVPNSASRQSSPAAVQPFLNAFPIPNGPDLGKGFAQYAASYSNPASLDAASIRIDHEISSKLILFGRYNYSPSTITQRGNVSSSITTADFSTQTMTVGLTGSLPWGMSDELRTNYSNVRGANRIRLDGFGGAVPVSDSLIFPAGFSSANSLFAFIVLGAGTSTSGLGSLSAGKTAINEQRQINLANDVSAVVGAHRLKFGVDYRWLSPIATSPVYQQSLVFSGISGGPGFATSGVASSATIQAFQNTALLSQNVSLYGQDTWKIKSRLTLTYGLRWDEDPYLRGKGGQTQPLTVTNFTQPASWTLAPTGTPLYATTYGNLAPRLGLAYQLRQRPGKELVVRGGGGIFYDSIAGFLGQLTFGFPFSAVRSFTLVPLPLTPQQATAPAITQNLPNKSTFYVADPNLKPPRTYQWNAALEQSLGANQTISASYVGAAGRKLLRLDAFSGPNTTFGSVGVTSNRATSDYDALQVKVQRRLLHGFQALASYTWSHSIDIASADSALGPSTPVGLASLSIDRGNSDFDIRHSFTSAITYNFPALRNARFVRSLFEGWSIDSFMTARSAAPLTLRGSTFVLAGQQYVSRPNFVSGIPLYLFGSQYPGGKILNNTPNQGGPGCKGPFCPANNGTQGNLPRNLLRGFGAWQEDFTVRRQFPLTEKVALQFRAEFFNIFNHPNFGLPANTLSSPLFGQSTQSLAANLGSGGVSGGFNPLYQIGGPRSIQLACKVQF